MWLEKIYTFCFWVIIFLYNTQDESSFASVEEMQVQSENVNVESVSNVSFIKSKSNEEPNKDQAQIVEGLISENLQELHN